MKTKNKTVQKLTRFLNSEIFARIVNYFIFGTWPEKPKPKAVQ